MFIVAIVYSCFESVVSQQRARAKLKASCEACSLLIQLEPHLSLTRYKLQRFQLRISLNKLIFARENGGGQNFSNGTYKCNFAAKIYYHFTSRLAFEISIFPDKLDRA